MEKFVNIKIGSGNAVHAGEICHCSNGDTIYLTACGSDQPTNRSMLRYQVVTTEVTCKKCIKKMPQKGESKGERRFI